MRFYVSPEFIFPEKKIIELRDRKEIHHIRDVMRLKKGANVIVFDGKGKEYLGDIKDINRNYAIMNITEIIDHRKNTPLNITLYQAIPKKGKMDFIVEKASGLGVDRIVQLITERGIVKFANRDIKKIERWERIANAASKQCGRVDLPTVSIPADFKNALAESKKSDLVLFAALDKDVRPLKTILREAKPNSVSVFIGP